MIESLIKFEMNKHCSPETRNEENDLSIHDDWCLVWSKLTRYVNTYFLPINFLCPSNIDTLINMRNLISNMILSNDSKVNIWTQIWALIVEQMTKSFLWKIFINECITD